MNSRSKLALILCCFAICGTAAIGHRVLTQRRESGRPAELYEVVWNQIRAFQKSDYSSAYQQVSTGFQERFNIEAFADLVRTDYPDLMHADRVEFGSVQFTGHRATVQVYFILSEGEVVPCIYTLVNEDAGWKIDGARVQKRWPSSRRLGGMRA